MKKQDAREVVAEALEQSDYASFLARLRISALEFRLRGRSPMVRLVDGSRGFRLKSLGLLDRFNGMMAVWYPAPSIPSSPDNALDALCEKWTELSEGRYVLRNSARKSVSYFSNVLGSDDVSRAMKLAADKIPNGDFNGRFKYFCGICHRMIDEKKDGEDYCEPVAH